MESELNFHQVWPALILLGVLLIMPSNYAFSKQEEPPPPLEFKSGVVASAHPLASEVGVEILKNGGNAVDAAVATAFALGVVEPNASGIGGGGFMMIYTARTKEAVTIDYREVAPRQATVELYQRSPDQMKSGFRAIAVPGTVAGMTLALQKYGTRDLKTVLQPAIQLADEGFAVTKLLSGMMASNAPKLLQNSAADKIYLKKRRPYQVGERLYQKDLAKTYRMIAENGPDAFYKGALAEAIAKEMKRTGTGLITQEDLASYQPILRPPVKGMYRGYEILSAGPPGAGTQVIELLNIFSGFDITKLGLNSAQAIAIMAQGMMQVFSERTQYMGDPGFVNIPLDILLSEEHAQKLRQTIKTSASKGLKVASGFHESDHTTHLSIADKDGNMAAITQSLNAFFGSGVVVPGTGILLNNDMGDFDPPPGGPNSIEPGKRPVSSMSPTLVLKEGSPILSIGMPGATRIIGGLPQILMNFIDHKLPLKEAIRAPRMHCVTGVIYLESRISPKVRAALIRRGYQLSVKKEFDLYFGGAQGVAIDAKNGLYYGAADPRREGAVRGY